MVFLNQLVGRIALVILISQAVLYAQTWTSSGPTGKDILAIGQSPTNQNILYVGAFGWGVFKSSDAGTTWVNQKSGMTNTYVRSILALSDELVFAGTNDGVFTTTNGGTDWSLSLGTLNSVRALAYDAATNSLFAATYGTGLYKSTNQGASWLPKTVSDPVSSETLIHQRAVAVFGTNALYVGGSIGDIGLGGALFKSVDGGSTWIQVQRSVGIRSSVKSIAISPSSPSSTLIIGTAAKGVYRSSNGGTNWNNIDTSGIANRLVDPQINCVGFGPTQMYAGTDSLAKLYYRGANDQTVGWLQGSGLPGPPVVVNSILIDRTVNSTLYIGTEGRGVHKSVNSGVAWQAQNNGMLGIAARVVKRNGNGALLVGTDFGDGIWRSSDQAMTWTKVDSLPTSNSITAFGVTTNPSVLFAGIYGSGVFKSTDAGIQWFSTDTNVISSFVRTISVNPTTSNQVFAGTGNGVYRTDNGGTSWVSVNNGIPVGTSVRSMAIDWSSPATLYVGTDSSYLYKTVNGGNTWTHVTDANGFLPQDIFIRCITIDYTFSNVVYAGADSGRIYKSTDAGSTWNLHTQLPSENSVRAILIHPLKRQIMFGATFGSGIFVSVDNGANWVTFNTGLTDLEVYSLECDNSNPLNLYAGTGSTGVFRTSYTYSGNVAVNLQVESGWNVVSVPLIVSDYQKSVLFPSAVSSAFAYHGGYAPRDTLQNGFGYWLKFPSGQSVPMSGLPLTKDSIDVDAGWNIIGSLTYPIPAANVRTVPPLTRGALFGFSNGAGYNSSDTVQPGRAYWMKVSQAGRVVLDTSSLGTELEFASRIISDRLSFSDVRGQARTFYLSSGQSNERSRFELPPPPPAGVLDVRFDTQQSLVFGSTGGNSEYHLRVTDAQFPLVFRWDVSSSTREWAFEVLSKRGTVEQVPLQGQGEIVLTEDMIPSAKLRFVSSISRNVPKNFALQRNFPNPFNPSTEIRYDLPSDGHVSLKIYNLLGQLVTTLVNGLQTASYRSVGWDGSSIPSGVYFCELHVTDPSTGGTRFRATQKMILLK